ncbi:MAG TPA: nitrophenyl compound nitroreductase subunit ArsF family protein [Candidatus Dependentiae bacterium]|nr:nitrophenyl compound nitroreductase subunit ArsF family protein [Candidatus Dependentiae bacterium]
MTNKIGSRLSVLLVALLCLAGCGKGDTTIRDTAKITHADKIEVVHFHGNRQCPSCKAVGDWVQKTIKEKFPQEYANGRILFKQVNVDLPENATIVNQFKARGSSLFFNIIKGKDERIIEDSKVWLLVNDETEFTNYIVTSIQRYLGR